MIKHTPAPIDPDVSWVTITPAKAAQWLQQHQGSGNFRRLNARTVNQYRRAMEGGQWRNSSSHSIAFDERGVLVDGQHRLHACVLSGVPFRSVVYRGVIDVTVLDTGKRRNFADWLYAHGEPDAKNMAAAVRWEHIHRHGQIGLTCHSQQISTQELLNTFMESADALRAGMALAREQSQVALGPMTFLSTRFLESDAQLARQFIAALETGANLSPEDPMLLLRRRLGAETTRDRATRVYIVEKMALVIKTWNAWVGNRPLALLRWRSVGPAAEPFPTVAVPAADDAATLAQ